MTIDPVPKYGFRRRLGTAARLLRSSPRHRLALAGVLAVLTAGGAAAQALALRSMIDNVLSGDRSGAMAAVLVGAIAAGANGAAGRLYENLQLLIASDLRVGLSRETLALTATMPGVEHLERPIYRDQIAIVNQGSEQMLRSVFSIADLTMLAARMALGIWILATVHPLLALIPLFAVPSVLLTPRQQAVIDRSNNSVAETRRVADYTHALFLQPAPATEMRLFGATAALDRYSTVRWRQTADTKFRAAVHAALVGLGGWLILTAGFAGALLFVVHQASKGRATAGDIVLVAQLVLQLRGNVAQATTAVRDATNSLRLTDRFLWLDDEATRQRARYGGTQPAPTVLHAGIELRNLSFTYPDSEHATLTDVSLRLAAGSTVALVGENGAGKSTLVKLLCRFYEPEPGQVTIDGVDVRDIDVAAWRAAVAATFQDHLRIEATALRSVGVGDVAHWEDHPRVLDAGRDADAAEFLNALPEGLASHIGTSYRAGAELSGGQWQRVAIARSMMRTTPLLRILDEPTAALDPTAEERLFARYAATATRARDTGSIVLLISHRFASARMADQIVVLEHGRVVETGTHEQLMTANGTYARMYNQQAAAYS